MKHLLFAGIALAGLAGFGTSEVQAGRGYDWHGGRSHGWFRSSPPYNYGGHGFGNRGYSHGRQGSAYRPHYDHHDTSPRDFHPGSVQRHYDYVPEHYDRHRSGHWDRH